jgi:hypothetical protein
MVFVRVFLYIFLGGLECVGHSCVYVAHFVFWRDVWIRTTRTAVGAFFSVT